MKWFFYPEMDSLSTVWVCQTHSRPYKDGVSVIHASERAYLVDLGDGNWQAGKVHVDNTYGPLARDCPLYEIVDYLKIMPEPERSKFLAMAAAERIGI